VTKWLLLAAAVVMAGGLLYLTQGRETRLSACKELVSACEQAGFKRGPSAQERRDFRNNCLRPILKTGTFRGQEFDPEIVSTCKARFDRRKSRDGEGGGGGGPGGGRGRGGRGGGGGGGGMGDDLDDSEDG
jgi:uncharacterized membrane protein YgcG